MQKIKQLAEEVILKGDRLLQSIGLLTITVVKRKFVDQVENFGPDTLPDNIAIAGVYETENGFYQLLFGYGTTTLKVGRCGLWNYAVKVLREERPEIFERTDTDDRQLREEEYKRESDVVEAKTKELQRTLPQIFTS